MEKKNEGERNEDLEGLHGVGNSKGGKERKM